ncbi:MAG: ATP-binding protein [Pirellula sp.]
MKYLLFKIGLAALLMQAVVVVFSSMAVGFSAYFVVAGLVATLGLMVYCHHLLKPLTDLVLLAPKMTAAGAPSLADPFDRIRDAIQLREEQLDRQQIKYAEYQERFESVLSGMAEGVIAIDSVGGILFLNRAARRILSIDLKNVIGKPLIGLVRYEAVQDATREALESHKIVDATFQTYDVHRRDVRLRVAPMAGEPISGMTLVFQDVTELVRLETVRRDFVANVSHELKTPLSSIKANAETLLMGAIHKSPQNVRFVEQIELQAEVLNRKVQDLLQLARIESGRALFVSEPVDLVAVCEESILMHQDEALANSVELSMHPLVDDGSGCWVWADRDALRTVFDNLVSNALRYSYHDKSGRRHAHVTLALSKSANQCIVEVSDNGIGIAPEHQARIFERFFRVDAGRSREKGGTGLGLAIVKHLVMSFGGQVEVKSNLGDGSVFRTCFPKYTPPLIIDSTRSLCASDGS